MQRIFTVLWQKNKHTSLLKRDSRRWAPDCGLPSRGGWGMTWTFYFLSSGLLFQKTLEFPCCMSTFPPKQHPYNIPWVVLMCRALWSGRILNNHQKQNCCSPCQQMDNEQGWSHDHSILCSFPLCTPSNWAKNQSHIRLLNGIWMNEWMLWILLSYSQMCPGLGDRG